MKSFIIDGEEWAGIYSWQHPDGPKIIDVWMNTLQVKDAKRFIKWLQKAVEEIEKEQKK